MRISDWSSDVCSSDLADALYGFIEEAPDEMRAMYLLRYASIDPGAQVRTNVAKAHKAQRRDVQRWIEGGQKAGTVAKRVDAALASELFCATVDGLIYRWLVNPKIASRELQIGRASGRERVCQYV